MTASDRLRIAHVVPSFVAGGIERLLEMSVRPMAERGIDYVLIAHSNELSAVENMRSQGVPVHVLPIEWRATRYWYSTPPELRRALNELTQKEQFDAIHVHHSGSYHVAYGLAKRLDKKLIISNQCLDEPWQRENSIWGRIVRQQIRKAHETADTVICVGEAVKQDTQKFGWAIKRIEIIENVASDKVWSLYNPEPNREFDVVMMGRLAPQKNVLFGLEALAAARKRGGSLRVALLGDGPLRGEVEQAIARLGLQEDVTVFGQKPLDEVYEICRRSKVFYAPSLFEGLSLASVEALAMGLRAVFSTITPFTLTFPDEDGVWFCDNVDVQANAAALTEAIREFAPISRPHLQERFNLTKNVEKTAAVYRRALHS